MRLRLEHAPGEDLDPERLYKALTAILQAHGAAEFDLQEAGAAALNLSKARMLASPNQPDNPDLAAQAAGLIDWYAKHVLPSMLDGVARVLGGV